MKKLLLAFGLVCLVTGCGAGAATKTPAMANQDAGKPATAQKPATQEVAADASDDEAPKAGPWIGAATPSRFVLASSSEQRAAIWVDVPKSGHKVHVPTSLTLVIDTSGSMQSQNWRYAEQKLAEVLNIYPKLKGIQVLDDEGGYMFGDYRGKWIPDSPARRKAILDYFRHWQAFSNSSPVEGIVAAIRTFWTRDHSISVYVFGDEFTGPSIQDVVDTVDRINRTAGTGERLIRIHALGFPIPGQYPQHTSMRYATLMRILCERNGGVFVGLPEGESTALRRSNR